MAKTAILYMRDGGVFITQAHGEDQDAKNLGARMLAGGGALFSDSFWKRGPRELLVNLADVSVIELYADGDGQEAAGD
jgi:hypothetical protein